jgi:hypothetical protein
MVTGAVLVGTTAGAAGIASAATTGSSSSSSTSTSSGSAASTAPAYGTAPTGAPSSVNPAKMTHGPGETLLTGTNLSSAVAAAKAAEPGATVIRAETDSSGKGTYEVHMQKSDGSDVTVYLNSSFKVTSTGSGFGAGPAGDPAGGPGGPGGGQAPSGAPGSSSGSSTAA